MGSVIFRMLLKRMSIVARMSPGVRIFGSILYLFHWHSNWKHQCIIRINNRFLKVLRRLFRLVGSKLRMRDGVLSCLR